jgi:hypothetical protein
MDKVISAKGSYDRKIDEVTKGTDRAGGGEGMHLDQPASNVFRFSFQYPAAASPAVTPK